MRGPPQQQGGPHGTDWGNFNEPEAVLGSSRYLWWKQLHHRVCSWGRRGQPQSTEGVLFGRRIGDPRLSLVPGEEFKLWEAAWKQLLRDALPSLLIDPKTTVNENGNPLTFEHLMVDPDEQGAWPEVEGEFIIIGDCKHTPQEIKILPGTLVNSPGSLVLWLCCIHQPTYLPKGQIITQMIPTWGPSNNWDILMACPVQAVTEERPQVACEFSMGGKALKIMGLLDTGAYVTKVPTKYWPSHWVLQDVTGHKPGKDKWQLLQDLCQMNNVIEDMGSLQAGMPFLTMLPKNWKLAVIDIKDCFFQIPLHPDNAPRFAFLVPTINREAPRRRYHWQMLPQGIKNSPVICQWYVASLLSPVHAAVDKAIIHHYMDDVLVCALNDDILSHVLDLTINVLIAAGFELQEDKVQRMPPWR
ncbi:hypothetical protein DUI87_13058 [Hirundo rustica rustica]|uniref:ribonuclease H n=1 Tax=Hirundo rustica rustica TaxID=333673 RepID=A0A3M0KAN2_HIRRU|nr:hypothetical protein DUI87_13058 [Hirundo rustica rustica]